MNDETFEHVVEAWNVGKIRVALEGLPDDLPVVVGVAEEPGGDLVDVQVVVDVGFGIGADARREEFVDRTVWIGCEFPSGTYHR